MLPDFLLIRLPEHLRGASESLRSLLSARAAKDLYAGVPTILVRAVALMDMSCVKSMVFQIH